MNRLVAALQPLGRALMLPIAVLPAASLLLRLGQPDLLNLPFLSAAGDAVFSNLGLLFAVGVATGFARDGHGSACLAGLVCYLVAQKGAAALVVPPASLSAGLASATAATVSQAWRQAETARFDVPTGLVAGVIGGAFHNRFARVGLPAFLAFFGGRRLAPILAGAAGVGLAAALGLAMPALQGGGDALGAAVARAGWSGVFLFGVANRLLLVTGLHHILNNLVYFFVGDWHGATGDLRRFFAGDPSAGVFMSGFFPVMMFGLPGACLAMYTAAPRARRPAVGGLLLSLALSSLLTGVTEPIEFSFMFLAPALYALHALLTGLAEVVMDALGVRLGYGFSAGLFDYVLNYGKATRPWLLAPVGAGYAALYYALFRWAIVRFDLPTPGRERAAATGDATRPADAGEGRGAAFVAALGGAGNLVAVEACTTRLRLTLGDPAALDEAALKRLGALGVLRAGGAAQVVVGPLADAIAEDMREALQRSPGAPALHTPPDAQVGGAETPRLALPPAWLAAFGGAANVRSASQAAGRLRVEVVDVASLRADALARLPILTWGTVSECVVHVLATAETLQALTPPAG